jgi:hypothetical protein
MAYATVDDLAARFPRALTSAEEAAAEIMLEDASFLLSIRVPGLQAAVDSEDEVITNAAMLTTVAMVKRALLSQAAQQTGQPGVDQVSQQFGPYSSTVKYRSDSGDLYLYASELDYLLGLLRDDPATAVSMRSPGF